jgi:hypothetical protein
MLRVAVCSCRAAFLAPAALTWPKLLTGLGADGWFLPIGVAISGSSGHEVGF